MLGNLDFDAYLVAFVLDLQTLGVISELRDNADLGTLPDLDFHRAADVLDPHLDVRIHLHSPIDRLPGLANATVGFQAEALRELADHFMVAEIQASQGQSGNGVNPNFDHEFEPVQDSGTSGSGDPITLPVR